MLQRLEIHRSQVRQRVFAREVWPKQLTTLWADNEASVRYSDGTVERSACLRCPDAPCLRFRTTELQPPAMTSFPGDGDMSVCPTGALIWSLDAGSGPIVDSDACIGCGICVQRCPVGAIQLTASGTAKVFDEDTRTLKTACDGDALKTREPFDVAERIRRVAVASDKSIDRLSARIVDVGDRSGPKFPNLLVRNLLTAAGWTTAMRRAGDTNVRLDLLAERKSTLCVTEVEFSDAVIDAPRSVLDGIAVLRSRYQVAADLSVGLVVVGALPNQRSEYWHVISDVKGVLGVKVHTVSAGALVLLVWEGVALHHLPFASLGNPSIRADIERNIGNRLCISPCAAAALEAPK